MKARPNQRLSSQAMAFVLAGGRGSRLKELTDKQPSGKTFGNVPKAVAEEPVLLKMEPFLKKAVLIFLLFTVRCHKPCRLILRLAMSIFSLAD